MITIESLPQVSRRRRVTDRAMRSLLLLALLLAMVPLILILFYLLKKGLGVWNANYFTTDPNGNFFGNPGGIRSAILGSLEIVGLASLVAIPAGLGVALWLTEYGRESRLARVVRYFVDVMTGVPSIMFGLFIYIVLVIAHTGGSGFAAWKGSVALALLMLPIGIRSSEVVLLLVPSSLKEAALALGAPRWQIIRRVVIPTALPRAHDGRAAGRGPRDGRDGTAAVHGLERVRAHREPELADEHDAGSDLQ